LIQLKGLEFKAEDFYTGVDGDTLLEQFMGAMGKDCADKANKLLTERIAKAPEVSLYGKDGDGTHKARLVCIEELNGNTKN